VSHDHCLVPVIKIGLVEEQVVGTHALLSEPVQFAQLGLAVVDEQHRFGVAQRAKLQNKNTPAPHVLAMTVRLIQLDCGSAFHRWQPFSHCSSTHYSMRARSQQR
jgi:hypothetical protein